VSFVDSLALGGLFIRTSQPPPVDSALSVILEAPTGDIRARAVVRRVGTAPSRGMGVEFIAMNQEDRARLSRLVTPLLASA
jgi:PilZ domain